MFKWGYMKQTYAKIHFSAKLLPFYVEIGIVFTMWSNHTVCITYDVIQPNVSLDGKDAVTSGH